MQIEINEQEYFLDFIPEESRWFLLQPTRRGIRVMPVVDDEPPPDSEVGAVN